MKGRMTIAALAALTVSFFSIAVRASEEKVPLDKVPAVVMKAVKDKFPKAKIKEASKEVEDGKTIFEVALKDGGRGVDVSLKEDGTILEIEKEIAATDLPAAVSGAVKAKCPKGEVKKAEEITKGEKKGYEVVVADGDQQREIVLDADGKILKDEDDETD